MSEYNIQMNKYNALNAEYDQLYPQPMKHASTHAKDGSDPITPADIGAYSKTETDALLAENVYTKTETNALLAGKANVANVYTKTEADTLLAGKAPAGYGLGGKGKNLTSSDDLNTIFQNGWYYWRADVPQNAPTQWPTGVSAYCMMRVWCYESGKAIQEISSVNYDLKYTLKRVCRNNVWTVEWDNPPMVLGVEYRTTERYMEKPVYKKMIQFGNIAASNTWKEVTYTDETTVVPFAYGGHMASGDAIPGMATYTGNTGDFVSVTLDIGICKNTIGIMAHDNTKQPTAYVWVKYYKTTD